MGSAAPVAARESEAFLVMAAKDEKIVGAWWDRKSKASYQVVYTTGLGTAHAGALRKPWRVPDDVRQDVQVVSRIAETVPAVHPLLRCDDAELAAAFERLLADESFAKIGLSDWEFRLASDAPSVFLKWGGFTWKQRKYLREIVKKIVEKR